MRAIHRTIGMLLLTMPPACSNAPNDTSAAAGNGGVSAQSGGSGGTPASGGSSGASTNRGGNSGTSPGGAASSGGSGAAHTGGTAGAGASAGASAGGAGGNSPSQPLGPRIACVGDSITQGIRATPYPEQLQALLGNSYQVQNDGVSGTTLMKNEVFGGSYWNTSAFQRAHDFLPNVVIILLGTNDMGIYDWGHIADYEGDYESMIDSFTAVSSHPTVFAGLPTWVYIPNTVTQLTDEKLTTVIIPDIKKAAAAKHVSVIDFHTLTQGHPEYYLEDGLHPNTVGYAAMAALVYKTVTR